MKNRHRTIRLLAASIALIIGLSLISTSRPQILEQITPAFLKAERLPDSSIRLYHSRGVRDDAKQEIVSPKEGDPLQVRLIDVPSGQRLRLLLSKGAEQLVITDITSSPETEFISLPPLPPADYTVESEQDGTITGKLSFTVLPAVNQPE
jgi:hypothetical protein